MLDFTKKDLYEHKKKDFELFLENVLVTRTERNTKVEIEEDTEDLSDDDISKLLFGGEAKVEVEDLLGSKEEQKEETLFIPEEKLGTPYEFNDFWKNIGVSPYYLFYFIFRSLGYGNKSSEHLFKFLKSLVKVSAVTSVISLVLVIFTDAKFLFSLEVQAFVSVIMFLVSLLAIAVIKNPQLFVSFNENDEIEQSEAESVEDEREIDVEVEDDFSVDKLKDLSELDFLMDHSDDEIEEIEDVEVIIEEPVRKSNGGSPIPHSQLDVSKSDDVFLEDLKRVFKENEYYKGKEILNRKELVMSFSDYLIANDKSFGTWNILKERGTVYNNIMFTMYLALIEIDNKFKDIYDEENRFYVIDAKENPLMYKIEFEVPRKYFKERTLKSKTDTFISKLKKSDDDLQVNILITTYQEGFVVKLFKPVAGLVSLGDILRYHNDDSDEQSYQNFLNDKMGLPLLLGLRNNEYPTVVDLADNTSVVIAGESGSGKSWGTFLVMMNLIYTNSYNDLNIVIMDRKKAVFWREFARLPHVVGYHTDVPQYFDILKELKAEMEYRKIILQRANKENWKSLRKDLLKEKDYEALKAFPWMVIIIDEMSNTMSEVEGIAGKDNAHILDGFKNDLATLAQEGRSLGMKLILIGQRTTANSIPKNNLVNSSMKLLFKLDQTDFERALNDVKNVTYPSMVGQALLQDFNISQPVLLRTLTVGGINDEQIINLIRMLAFEWTRRSLGNELMPPRNMSFTYNRNIIREKVIEDMNNGKLTISTSDSNIGDLANALLNGIDITRLDDNELMTIEIEKEDSFGNVIDMEDEDEVHIQMDDSELEYYPKYENIKKVNLDKSVSDNKVVKVSLEKEESVAKTNNVTNNYVKNDSSFEPINTPGDLELKKRKVINQLGKRSNLPNKPKAIIDGSISREKSLSDLKKSLELEKQKRSVEKFPIAYYIQKYGDGGSIKKLHKSEIEKIYTFDEINRALNSLEIVLDGEFYQS